MPDKVNFELEAEAEGVLRKIIALEKSQVPLGYVVAILADADEDIPDVSAENETLMKEYRASVTGKTVAAPTDAPAHAEPAARPARVRATPRARRLARGAGVDLAKVQKAAGSETVTEKDVETWMEENPS